MRAGWSVARLRAVGIGTDLKNTLRKPGSWLIFLSGFGEMLPNRNNRITLHPTKTDKWGIPQVHIECVRGDNELKMKNQMTTDARAMMAAAGAIPIPLPSSVGNPGIAVHEMGTACMGKDPTRSVLNKYNQLHDIANVFVTDGAAMASGGCQNPSITYMALSARAAHHATEFLKASRI
jgi:choline dehydrogenase-like flavoprotein